MLLEINQEYPQGRLIRQIVESIREGGIVIYPTDTTYGFGCDLFNRKAVEKILAIKRVPRNKLLSLICSDLKVVSQYGHLTNQAYKLMKRCLPGPYTFILKATQLVPRVMMTRQKTIGIRIPENKVALGIVEQLGHPIITTSVRLQGEEIMCEPIEIDKRLGHLVDTVIDAGIILPYPSSIIDLSVDTPLVLREGKGDTSFVVEV